MLVLTRKTGESIQIGDNIEIKVISIQGDQIKLGIDAPKHIDIHRKEVYLSIQEQNTEASKGIQNLLNLLPKNEKKSFS
ncbi:carbon storage regulator CsrA [Rossellomorea marisflavi]|uniref:carbon storage regulator CsrA n=1 Tax=Rossellomorea marisflavi TaxID=189381 RepID=UPI00064F5092|nr:carbon storage regulator CsrA [Rossellomorea marisflavi]KMK92580.1 carbon storage regulator [Rossellomorea marisflavi]KML05538.1 carbon storage regulator [Rossellomorea marisflavi]